MRCSASASSILGDRRAQATAAEVLHRRNLTAVVRQTPS